MFDPGSRGHGSRYVLFALLALLAVAARGEFRGGPPVAAAQGESIQLAYAVVPDEELGLPDDLRVAVEVPPLPREIPGRRIPGIVPFSELTSATLAACAVPLPEANTLAHLSFQTRRFGRLQSPEGAIRFFNPGFVLVKFRGQDWVQALHVEPMQEWAALRLMEAREDVEFAELDFFEQRQFTPGDPLLAGQWHHSVVGSFAAWDLGLGATNVAIAIVDTPFQMNHPDLAPNTVPGWDAVANVPVTSGAGIAHSTLCAGLAAAAINNDAGVAGMANCRVLPININGAISEMYNAILWAANHGVRVVSISWSGANSPTIEAAAWYLKTNIQGLVIMAAIDGGGYLNWTNQPDIWCVSMTDQYDNFTGTMYGPYIDFAAPGYQVFATTTGGGYASGIGTSYATPVFAGAVAWLLSLNPTLGAQEVITILTNTVVDLGPPGWDPYFGWGRLDFGAAAAMVAGTLPNVSGIQSANGQVTLLTSARSGMGYSLWRSTRLAPPAWLPVTNALISTNAGEISLTDPTPPGANAFYRIQASGP